MDHARRVHLSKLLSLALRHEPAALGLVLDASGWVDVEAVLAGLEAKGKTVTREELALLVAASDKQRFALSEDGARIRANQGHSVSVDLGLTPEAPPETLFHGTSSRFLASIREKGLVPGSRTHVHLSKDVETAVIVAKRRAGPHVILRVRSRALFDTGHAFLLSQNGVWLTAHVPPAYLEPPEEP